MLIFIRGTCLVLIFLVHRTYCMLISLVLTPVPWLFTSWTWFCSWSLLRADFCCMVIFLFRRLHIDFSLVNMILFMELVACSFFVREPCCKSIFFFVKLVHLLFFSWNWSSLCNLLHVYFSLFENCVLIFLLVKLFCQWNLLRADFVHGSCCGLIFLLKLVACRFFSSWNF